MFYISVTLLITMEVVLDSSFILSCIRKRIDFLDQLEEQGFSPRLPQEVFQELKDLRLSVGHDDRVAIDVAMEMFERRKVKKIKLGHKKVDLGLIEKGKSGSYVATLDKVIKRQIPKVIVIFDSTNKIGPAPSK